MSATDTARKLTLLGSLYLAQGLPDGFFRQTLPVMLRREGVSLEGIGLATLLMPPWGLKFLWAPLVDRHGSLRFGRRRSWIVPLQLTAIAVMLLLAQSDPQHGLAPLLVGVLLIDFIAATQDIAASYALLAMVVVLATGLASALSGFSAQALGYPAHFVLAAALCLAATGLVLLHRARVLWGDSVVATLP